MTLPFSYAPREDEIAPWIVSPQGVFLGPHCPLIWQDGADWRLAPPIEIELALWAAFGEAHCLSDVQAKLEQYCQFFALSPWRPDHGAGHIKRAIFGMIERGLFTPVFPIAVALQRLAEIAPLMGRGFSARTIQSRIQSLHAYNPNWPEEPREDHTGRWTDEDGDPGEPKGGDQAKKDQDETDKKKQAFVDKYCAEMNAAAKELGVPVKWVQAVSALESAWGTSDAAIHDNNLFGLHGRGTAGSRPAKDDPTVSVAKFTRAIDSIKRFSDLVGNGWIADQRRRNSSSISDFARYLQDGPKFGWENGVKRSGYEADVAKTAANMPDCSHTQSA